MADISARRGGAAASVPAARRRAVPRPAWRRNLFPYLLVAPAVLYLLMITLYPGVYAIYQSFFVIRFFKIWVPVGFDNYAKLFADWDFWSAVGNTLIMGGIALALEVVIAMTLAFYAYRDPFIRNWRIVFLMPMLFMPSAVAYLWQLAFSDGRVIADLLMRVGLASQNIDWMGSVWNARAMIIVTDVWQWTPFLFIIFVAALQAQDQEIEEAARLDGARWSDIFWNISLPMMRPVIAIGIVLRGIDITTMFTSVYIMTQGTPGGATETISYFIYRNGFKMTNFGYASAASVVMLALTVIVAQLLLKRFFKTART